MASLSSTASLFGETNATLRPHGLMSACFLALLAMAFIGPWPPVFFGDDLRIGDDGSGDLVKQAIFTINLALIMFDVVRRRGLNGLGQIPAGFLAIAAWLVLSSLWAVEPATSLRRTSFGVVIILSVVYLVREMPQKLVLQLLFQFCVAILVADYLSLALLPGSIHPPFGPEAALAGDWRGLHLHKNEAGAFCAICVIVFAHRIFLQRRMLPEIVLILVALFFLLKTGSKTPLGCLPLALAFGGASPLLYRYGGLRLAALLLTPTVIAFLLMVYGSDAFQRAASMFDDPGELTGRVQIWPVVFAYASDHLLLGSGYGSFWSIGSASPIYNYTAGWVTMINHAHNGYLNMLVQTGLVGLGLVLFVMILRPLWTLIVQPCGSAADRFLLSAIIMYVVSTNMLESSLLDRSNPTWVMLLIVYMLLPKIVARCEFSSTKHRELFDRGDIHAPAV